MAKRKATPLPKTTASAKRARQDQQFTNIKSIREQAEPYRLATARFPIAALTSTWRIGSNRLIDAKHVQDLCRIFEEERLQREQVENHLLVACSRADFERMMAHLQNAEKSRPALEDCSPSWPDFSDWMLVNGCKVEIMGGQHRVEALKVFLACISKRPGASAVIEEQSWWICEIYDQREFNLNHVWSS
jgi:hypothetical protein